MIKKMNTNTQNKIKSTVYVRAYDSNFEIDIYRDKPVEIDYAKRYVQSQIITTAMVVGVKHFLPHAELYVANEGYKQFEITSKHYDAKTKKG